MRRTSWTVHIVASVDRFVKSLPNNFAFQTTCMYNIFSLFLPNILQSVFLVLINISYTSKTKYFLCSTLWTGLQNLSKIPLLSRQLACRIFSFLVLQAGLLVFINISNTSKTNCVKEFLCSTKYFSLASLLLTSHSTQPHPLSGEFPRVTI